MSLKAVCVKPPPPNLARNDDAKSCDGKRRKIPDTCPVCPRRQNQMMVKILESDLTMTAVLCRRMRMVSLITLIFSKCTMASLLKICGL
jgi:hypothetical protein